jgi:hypothetical protein
MIALGFVSVLALTGTLFLLIQWGFVNTLRATALLLLDTADGLEHRWEREGAALNGRLVAKLERSA